jgi:uncharacterized protein (DUF952 family)
MEWATYLTTGVGESLYHMCDEEEWKQALVDGKYVPPTFEQDGFIHATAEPQFLIEVANHFYQSSKGKWICLKIDPNSLGSSKVIYEAPAPVGEVEAFDHKEKDDKAPKFPHIYGPICTKSVISFSKIVRDDAGKFLSIEGIC